MKHKRILGVAVVVMGSIVGMLVAVRMGVGASNVLYGVRAQVKEEAVPEEGVRGFYDWCLTSIDLQLGRNLLADRVYWSSESLSKDFVSDVDPLLDPFGRGGYAPFLLAQDSPQVSKCVRLWCAVTVLACGWRRASGITRFWSH